MAKTESSPQSEPAPEKDWTKGSIIGNLLLLSWPMVLMEAIFMLGQIVDMIWVGRIGPSAIAGVGIGSIFFLIAMSMDVGLIMGVRAMVARYVGAGDMRGASNVAGQAIILGALWGITLAIIGLAVVKPLFELFGVEAEVVAEGVAYLRILFAGWIAMGVLVMGLYSIQASGDTMKPMITEASIRTVHVIICPFLVLGLWIFPRMGVTGAALSNVIAHSLGAIIVVSLLFSGRTRLRITFKDFRPVPDLIWRILKIGIPSLVLHAQKSTGDLVLAWLIVPFGTLAVAAHSIVIRVEMIFIAIGIGLGGGAGVLAGQNLGAGEPKRAEKSGWMAAGLIEMIMVIFCIAILLKAEGVVRIFTSETELIEIGAVFLRIATAGYLVFGIVMVFQDCIAGTGDTLPTMIVSIAMIWLVQLPLAFYLPGVANLGVYGIRWAIVASLFTGAVFYIIYFSLGRWKTKKI
jgi:putative MATE family efflux protein